MSPVFQGRRYRHSSPARGTDRRGYDKPGLIAQSTRRYLWAGKKSSDIPQPECDPTTKSSKARIRARLRVSRIIQENTHKNDVPSPGTNLLPPAIEILPKTCLPVSAPECALIKLDPFDNLPSDLNRSGQNREDFARSLFLDSPPNWVSGDSTKDVGLCFAHVHKPLLCCMLAVTSAYLDSVLDSGLSPDTLHWTAANVQYTVSIA